MIIAPKVMACIIVQTVSIPLVRTITVMFLVTLSVDSDSEFFTLVPLILESEKYSNDQLNKLKGEISALKVLS